MRKQLKILLTIFTLFIGIAAFAQPVSKKGEYYLPRQGDWAVGIDASPVLEYIGNIFSDGFNPSPEAAFTNTNFAIVGKKFKRDDLAYRAGLRLGVLADSYRAFSLEFSQEATNTTVEDTYNRTFSNVYASLGIEKRKGSTRIQGFYGVEGIMGFGTEKHTFDYGNGITAQNTNPTRSEWEILFQNDPIEQTTLTEVGGFITEYKKGTTFNIGARAFIGAEIFLFPKWSIGFEYGFGAGYTYTGNSSIISEQWTVPAGGSNEQFVTTIADEGGSGSFRLDTDNSGGAVFMFFYF
jgi:hypothetical protein